jgi:hypothetical protein
METRRALADLLADVGPVEPAPTLREPPGDIRAQWRALNDPAHPKDAMWLSKDNPMPPEWRAQIARAPGSYSVVDLAHGTLITNDPAKAERFRRYPTEEALADVLGYVRPKSRLDPNRAYVLQAVDSSNNVITEMAVEPEDERQARRTLERHGIVRIKTLAETVARRLSLFSLFK